MVDSGYSMSSFKSAKKYIGTVTRNPEMLIFFLIILKLKK